VAITYQDGLVFHAAVVIVAPNTAAAVESVSPSTLLLRHNGFHGFTLGGESGRC